VAITPERDDDQAIAQSGAPQSENCNIILAKPTGAAMRRRLDTQSPPIKPPSPAWRRRRLFIGGLASLL